MRISTFTARVVWVVCSGCASLFVAFGMLKLATVLYLSTPGFEQFCDYFVPAVALALPAVVWTSATVGTALGTYLGLSLPLSSLGSLLGTISLALTVGRGDADHFFFALREDYNAAFGFDPMSRLGIWIAIPIWWAVGVMTARGLTLRRVEGVWRSLAMLTCAAVAGAALLGSVYFPVVRAEMREVAHLSSRIQDIAAELARIKAKAKLELAPMESTPSRRSSAVP